jgi:hypothetical protein
MIKDKFKMLSSSMINESQNSVTHWDNLIDKSNKKDDLF